MPNPHTASPDLHGSCLCGAIHYRVIGTVARVSHCHCQMCQKAHGAACGSYGTVLRTQLHVDDPEHCLRQYRSSAEVLRSFCSRCGSPLFWQSEEAASAQEIAFALGSLDTPFEPPAQTHIYTASRAAWHHITDHWPQTS